MSVRDRWIRLYLWICAGLTFGVFGLIWYYAWKNTSGHTGVSLGLIDGFFFLMAATGAISRWTCGPYAESHRPTRLLLLWSVLGACFSTFLASTRILTGYEHWLKIGQPAVPGNRDQLLLAYLALFGFTALIAVLKPAPATAGETPDQSASRSHTLP